MRVETRAEQLLFTTLRIEAGNSVGTGFIIHHEWESQKLTGKIGGYFLVTNKHVIENTNDGRFVFSNASDDGQKASLGQLTPIIVKKDDWKWWTGHPSDDIDVAVLPLEPVLSRLSDIRHTLFFRSIPTSMIPGPDVLKDIGPIENVLFIGYPIGIYDRTNNLPIVRQGITATPANVDYEGKPIFLIDASVFPGSSGSPVFIYNAGAWSTKKGFVVGNERAIFLGVLSSAIFCEIGGSLHFKEIPTNLEPVVRTREMVDLGVVYKARTVLETIEYFLCHHGEIPKQDVTT